MSATFTDANFETQVLRCNQLSVIDFWATWCPPCVALGPIIDSLANDYAGKVNIGKLNADENPQTAIALGVTNLPCVLFMLEGKVIDRQIGAAPKAVYEKKVKRLLGH